MSDPKRIVVHDSAAPRYLTVKAVGEYFAMSTMTIRRLVDAGDIKAIKVGHAWRIPVEELHRIETENVIEPGTLGHTDYSAAYTEARRQQRSA